MTVSLPEDQQDFGFWIRSLSGYLICWCEFLLSGWAPFCYMNREIRAVMSRSLRRCHARHLHCRRDGYENHVNCMRMSRGGCLDPIKLACREGLKFCHMAKNETTDIIRLVQEVSAELFQIRKWGHKCTVFHRKFQAMHKGPFTHAISDAISRTKRALPYPARMSFSRSIVWIGKKVMTYYLKTPFFPIPANLAVLRCSVKRLKTRVG